MFSFRAGNSAERKIEFHSERQWAEFLPNKLQQQYLTYERKTPKFCLTSWTINYRKLLTVAEAVRKLKINKSIEWLLSHKVWLPTNFQLRQKLCIVCFTKPQQVKSWRFLINSGRMLSSRVLSCDNKFMWNSSKALNKARVKVTSHFNFRVSLYTRKDSFSLFSVIAFWGTHTDFWIIPRLQSFHNQIQSWSLVDGK